MRGFILPYVPPAKLGLGGEGGAPMNISIEIFHFQWISMLSYHYLITRREDL